MQKLTSPVKKIALKIALVQGFAIALALALGIVLWLMGCFIEASFIEFGFGLRFTTVVMSFLTSFIAWTYVIDRPYCLDNLYDAIFNNKE